MDNGLITLLSELREWTRKSSGLTKILVLLLTYIFCTIWLAIAVCKPLVEKGVEIVSLVLEHLLLHVAIQLLALLVLLLLALEIS